METFFIALAVIVLGGACVGLFVFEPRRKITIYEINIPLNLSPNMPPSTKTA